MSFSIPINETGFVPHALVPVPVGCLYTPRSILPCPSTNGLMLFISIRQRFPTSQLSIPFSLMFLDLKWIQVLQWKEWNLTGFITSAANSTSSFWRGRHYGVQSSSNIPSSSAYYGTRSEPNHCSIRNNTVDSRLSLANIVWIKWRAQSFHRWRLTTYWTNNFHLPMTIMIISTIQLSCTPDLHLCPRNRTYQLSHHFHPWLKPSSTTTIDYSSSRMQW